MTETPAGYVSWPAADKADWLWQRIEESIYSPTDRPPLAPPPLGQLGRALGVVRRSGLRVTLERSDDLMPSGRPKVIHRQGAVAMASFVIDDHSAYSGILAPADESAVGVVRMSLATPPGPTRGIVPGLAMKILVSGEPSLDLLAMQHTNGQGHDVDLFSNTMTHDLFDTHKYLRRGQRLMGILFARVSKQPRRLSIDHFVRWQADGTEVPSEARHRPHRLIFVPSREVRNHFDRYPAGTDFRTVLSDIKPHTTLYSIEAEERNASSASSTQVIGRIIAATGFVSAEVGDNLFFRHMQNNADLQPDFRNLGAVEDVRAAGTLIKR